MKIVHLTYSHVRAGQTVGALSLRAHDDKVDAFLLDHVADLRKRQLSGNCPFSTFVDATSSALFDSLRDGTEQDFLDTAGTLTTRLVNEMNGTTAPGLLVCVRIEHDTELSAAALKLEVMAEHGAVLEQLDTGEMQLSSATDVLQVPGELQKGALVPDPRAPESEVIVGDRLSENALYFPRAFGITTERRTADTASAVVAAVHRVNPAISPRVAATLPHVSPGPVRQVLDTVAAAVPDLTPQVIDEVVHALDTASRPVKRVDTGGPVKKTISVDGITISGSPAAMEKVDVAEDPEVGYRITIETSTRPVTDYKR